MNETLINMIVEVVFALFALGGIYCLTQISKRLKAEIEEGEANEFEELLYMFVRAAEQMFKKDDPTGDKRKAYVVERLCELGVKITEEVNALIEAAVFDLNLEIGFMTEVDSGDEVEEEKEE